MSRDRSSRFKSAPMVVSRVEQYDVRDQSGAVWRELWDVDDPERPALIERHLIEQGGQS